VEIYERLDIAAARSSDAWNNAGTGQHSAFCELNYTPESEDGSINPKKQSVRSLLSFRGNFGVSRSKENKVPSQKSFASIPHLSFVWGLKKCELPKQI
jgi:malate dehydrogenase (quinone)